MRSRKETGLTLLRSVAGFKGNLKVSPGHGPGSGFTAGPGLSARHGGNLPSRRCPGRRPEPAGATPAFSRDVSHKHTTSAIYWTRRATHDPILF